MIHSTRLMRALLFSFAFVLAMCFMAETAHAGTVFVGTCNPRYPEYSTIQAGVTAAGAGGTVYVCPGTYPEQVTITTKLTLYGYPDGSNEAPVIVPPANGLGEYATDIFGNPVAAQIFVNAGAANTVIIGRITVDGTGNNVPGCTDQLEGIYYQNTSGTITDTVVRNQYQTDIVDYSGCQTGLAINVEGTTSAMSVNITSNSVHAYQKNGITASGAGTGVGSVGPSVTISGNDVTGIAATEMNWAGLFANPTYAFAAGNGIQIGLGATGKVTANIVNDNIWSEDTSSQPYNAASGILVFASVGVSVTGNYVGSAQFGIVADTDGYGYCAGGSSCGIADDTTITGNHVIGTQIFDGIDACSNGNTVESNTIFGSTESGVHVDDTCTNSTLGTTSGNNNTVTKNIVNEACAGILAGTGTGNTTSPNTLYNVTTTTLSGDVCPVPADGPDKPAARPIKARPLPYRPYRR
jgi:hypothetical protein